jgi:1-acyl-sn-glycerol-3-phosphate acyltransferase
MPPPSSPPSREPARWPRRLVTIPGVLLGFCLVSAALPAMLAAAVLLDAARAAGRRTWISVRVTLFLWAYLAIDTGGLLLLALVGLGTLGSPARRERLTWPVQRLYTGTLMRATRVLFSLDFVVEGEELAAEGGPVLVFVRHASIVDTLIPSVFIANRFHLRLRFVLKRELLVAPCLDVAGHWIPNYFVARDGADSAREIAAVEALKDGIGARDGVLLYPEGTRFSEEKRRRLLARLEPPARARVERLRHVLPVRPGGALALLSAAPACDVIFLGHTGLEGFVSVTDIWAGAMVGQTVRVKMWRERADLIPAGREALLAWLEERWERLDGWITSQSAPAEEERAHAA